MKKREGPTIQRQHNIKNTEDIKGHSDVEYLFFSGSESWLLQNVDTGIKLMDLFPQPWEISEAKSMAKQTARLTERVW